MMINFSLKSTCLFNHYQNNTIGFSIKGQAHLHIQRERERECWAKHDLLNDVEFWYSWKSLQSQIIRVFVQTYIKWWWVNGTTTFIHLQCIQLMYLHMKMLSKGLYSFIEASSSSADIDKKIRHTNTLCFLRDFFTVFF